jgi:hypothetical protein
MRHLLLFAALFFASVGVAAQQAEKGTVILYRMTRATASVGIWIDGKEAVTLDYRSRAVAQLPPGKHEFRSNTGNYSVVLDIEAGKTYYLREEYGYGKYLEPKILLQVSEEIGRTQNLKTKPVDAKNIIDSELIVASSQR